MKNDVVKHNVRQFYNRVGWKEISKGVYQNAQSEDLRPVPRSYIHYCNPRVNQHLIPDRKYFLDAGSGQIQYPQYLPYLESYQYRVCLDISIVALIDARARIGDHGLFVVGDIAHLPFRKDVFDGIVSLDTIHHVPESDYLQAYNELRQVLAPNRRAVVVNGWKDSALMGGSRYPMLIMERILKKNGNQSFPIETGTNTQKAKPQGTLVQKLDARNLREMLKGSFQIDIKVWRSVSVRFLRAMIHPWALGKFCLGVLYLLEEAFPRFFRRERAISIDNF